MQRVRNKLTYANVVASLALFLVLSGATAYAASHLAPNSVGAKQLKSSAVTTSKLKRNAVTATKIRLGSVTAAKIEKGAVTEAKIGDGAVTGAKIKDGAISAQQLGAQSVGNSQTQLVKVFKAGAVAAAASEAAAPKVELGTVGPFHFYAKCFHGQTAVIEQSYIELTSGVATLGTVARVLKKSAPYLTPALPESERVLNSIETEPNSIGQALGATFEAAASDGTTISGIASGGAVKQGTFSGGNGPFLAGDSCIVGTTAVFGGK
jgi:hypothetical protein